MGFSLTIFNGEDDVAVADSVTDEPQTLKLHESQSVVEINREMRDVLRDIRNALKTMRALIRYEWRSEDRHVIDACRDITASHLKMLLKLDESITWNQGEIHLNHEGEWPKVDQPVAHTIPADKISAVVTEHFPGGNLSEDFDVDALAEVHNRISELVGEKIIDSRGVPSVDDQTWYIVTDGDDTDPDGPSGRYSPDAAALTRAA